MNNVFENYVLILFMLPMVIANGVIEYMFYQDTIFMIFAKFGLTRPSSVREDDVFFLQIKDDDDNGRRPAKT